MVTTLETIRLIRDEFGLNMTLGASNVSFGLPSRHALGAGFLTVASYVGLTSAIMDARNGLTVDACRAADLLFARDEWGMNWIAAHRQAGRLRARDAPGGPRGDATPAEEPARVTLRFEPSGTSVRVPPGVTVFDAASWNGIAIDSTCGGHGTCKKCRIRIEDGDVPASPLDARAFTPQELEAGWRLACRAQASGDLEIEVPPLVTRPKAATVGVGRQVILRPALQKRYVELDEPTLHDQRSDFRRLQDAIDDLELRAEAGVLRRLPRVLRESDFRVTAVVVDDLLIDVEPGDTTGRLHAIAFDLGTTTVVATLIDVGTGTPVAVASMLNKQQPFGADVISRISATMLDAAALPRLTGLAAETLQELADDVCEQAGIEPAQVYEVALAGNATMTAIALGVDPEPLGVAPFILAAQSYPEMPAAELGLKLHPRRAGDRLPRPRRLRRRRHRRGHAGDGDDPRPRPAPPHRRRDELRGRPGLGRRRRLHRRARRPRLRGRPDRLRHAGGGGRDRGRAAPRRSGGARRDRRRRAGRDLRLRPRRRGRGARPRRPARQVRPLRPAGGGSARSSRSSPRA